MYMSLGITSTPPGTLIPALRYFWRRCFCCVSYCDGAQGHGCFLPLLFSWLLLIVSVNTMNPGKHAGVEKGYEHCNRLSSTIPAQNTVYSGFMLPFQASNAAHVLLLTSILKAVPSRDRKSVV